MWQVWGRTELFTWFGAQIWRKRAFEKGRHKWEDNIKMDLNYVGRGDIDGIHLTEERDN
jgi:hypothetical protein